MNGGGWFFCKGTGAPPHLDNMQPLSVVRRTPRKSSLEAPLIFTLYICQQERECSETGGNVRLD